MASRARLPAHPLFRATSSPLATRFNPPTNSLCAVHHIPSPTSACLTPRRPRRDAAERVRYVWSRRAYRVPPHNFRSGHCPGEQGQAQDQLKLEETDVGARPRASRRTSCAACTPRAAALEVGDAQRVLTCKAHRRSLRTRDFFWSSRSNNASSSELPRVASVRA